MGQHSSRAKEVTGKMGSGMHIHIGSCRVLVKGRDYWSLTEDNETPVYTDGPSIFTASFDGKTHREEARFDQVDCVSIWSRCRNPFSNQSRRLKPLLRHQLK